MLTIKVLLWWLINSFVQISKFEGMILNSGLRRRKDFEIILFGDELYFEESNTTKINRFNLEKSYWIQNKSSAGVIDSHRPKISFAKEWKKK